MFRELWLGGLVLACSFVPSLREGGMPLKGAFLLCPHCDCSVPVWLTLTQPDCSNQKLFENLIRGFSFFSDYQKNDLGSCFLGFISWYWKRGTLDIMDNLKPFGWAACHKWTFGYNRPNFFSCIWILIQCNLAVCTERKLNLFHCEE